MGFHKDVSMVMALAKDMFRAAIVEHICPASIGSLIIWGEVRI
jgi:hypothetical protein